jgi:C4-dicarboxylate transporter DctM subunit
MTLMWIGIIGIIVLLLVLFILGMPVGFAMAVVGFCGFWYTVSYKAAMTMVGLDIWSTFSSYGLTVVPVYIFMGYLAFSSGIAERLYNAAYKWVGHWPGGLAVATIGADELFAAICGSNTATAATMGTVALPQMKKYNYDARLSSGTVATGGTLGVVMPPSVVLIIIGLQTGQSIAELFLAGILPALLLGSLFVATILFLCRASPRLGPPGPKTSLREKVDSLPSVLEAIAIFVMVIGGLYAGIFTPTEAGAFGVFATFIVSLYVLFPRYRSDHFRQVPSRDAPSFCSSGFGCRPSRIPLHHSGGHTPDLSHWRLRDGCPGFPRHHDPDLFPVGSRPRL